MTGKKPQNRRKSGRARQARSGAARLALIGGIVLVLIGAVTTALLLGGDEAEPSGPAAWSTADYTGGPRLAVDQTVIDDGDVAYGHEVKAVFRVKNVGDQPLDLGAAEVQTLDGC